MCNAPSIQIITVDCASWRTRQLRIRAAGLKEQSLLGQVLVGFVSGSRNGADVGTTSVPFCRLKELLGILGLAVFQEDTPASGPQARQSSMAVSPRMLVSVVLLLRATEAETAPPGADPEGSRDFTIFVVMVAIYSIAMWEALKWMIGKGCTLISDAIRASRAGCAKRGTAAS